MSKNKGDIDNQTGCSSKLDKIKIKNEELYPRQVKGSKQQNWSPFAINPKYWTQLSTMRA